MSFFKESKASTSSNILVDDWWWLLSTPYSYSTFLSDGILVYEAQSEDGHKLFDLDYTCSVYIAYTKDSNCSSNKRKKEEFVATPLRKIWKWRPWS